MIDHQQADPVEVDHRLLCWGVAWSWAMTLVVVALSVGIPVVELSNPIQLIYGIAIGGLSSVWTAIGTWIALIHLPKSRASDVSDDDDGARVWPRVAMAMIWLPNVVFLCVMIRFVPQVLALILLTVSVGVLGTVVIWQWTRQPIHRGIKMDRQKRSIRQILGLTTTIALSIAILNGGGRGLELSPPTIALVVSFGILWVMMTAILLGRWWWLAVLSIPCVICQSIIVSFAVDSQTRNLESEIWRFGGMIVGFYLFTLMILALMRSSGHRWNVGMQRGTL